MSNHVQAGRLKLGKVTRTDFVKFAGAGGDFNPIHHDDDFARAAGFPSVFAMGMYTASLASRFLTDTYGLSNIRSYKVRFLTPTWPNENLAVEWRVAGRSRDGQDTLGKIEFLIENDATEPKISGEAEVVLR